MWESLSILLLLADPGLFCNPRKGVNEDAVKNLVPAPVNKEESVTATPTLEEPQAKPTISSQEPQTKPTISSQEPQAKPTISSQEPQAKPTISSQEPQAKPTISSLHITSNIKYRYATTLISTRVVNPANHPGEATFTVTLPESAFISEFLMVVKDKEYKAYVKEKEEAKAIYKKAVDSGSSAGHVALDARDSNQFTVTVNIEAHDKVTFYLTYEQLLKRNLGVYSNVININPQQIVEDMSIIVDIEELTAIKDLEVPELQLSNEAVPEKHHENAKIEEKSPNHKQVIWAPTPEEQKSQKSTGLSGQFIVKYDVDREQNSQQILVDEGYFVHFFAPEDLPKLRKHVIFVLDFSQSMDGRKLAQLKEAMKQIFSELKSTDYFSIVVFQSFVEVWSPSNIHRLEDEWKVNYGVDHTFVVEATPGNIEQASSFMQNYRDLGMTNIMGGLRTGLQLVDIGRDLWSNESDPPQPVIMFLTDGQPNVEVYNTNVIISETKKLNTKNIPIFSLAFGQGADYNFLRKLSLQNSGFARNIYEAADATQQLNNFYKTIASPLMSEVTFTYLPGQVDNSFNTKQEFPVFFSGSELVVAGRVNNKDVEQKIGELQGMSGYGRRTYPITVHPYRSPYVGGEHPRNTYTVGHLEKMWSYLTIQQLLDKADSLDNGEEKNQTKKKALDLALQYAFVTPLTSLVVVKPDETESSVDATKVKPGSGFPDSGFVGPPVPSENGGSYDNFDDDDDDDNYGTTMAGSNYGQFVFDDPDDEDPFDDFDFDDPAPEPLASKISWEEVKWLQQALKAPDKSVTINGNSYKLGINKMDSSFGECTVNNDKGECHHIQYCALDVFRDDVSKFLPYQCTIPGAFLGVCCPKRLI